MDEEEAKIVLDILSSCDDGCVVCVGLLYKEFIKHFPQFEELARRKFKEEFGGEIEDAIY